MLIRNLTVLEPSNFHCLPESCSNEILPDNSSFMCSHSLKISNSLAQENRSSEDCVLLSEEFLQDCDPEVM